MATLFKVIPCLVASKKKLLTLCTYSEFVYKKNISHGVIARSNFSTNKAASVQSHFRVPNHNLNFVFNEIIPKSQVLLNSRAALSQPICRRCSNSHVNDPLASIELSKELSESLLTDIVKVDECEDDESEEPDNILEEEIIDFLSWRNISYEDSSDSVIIIACPNCTHPKESVQELPIDKKTGSYFCPRCCSDGDWAELCKLLDSHSDDLTPEGLTTLLELTVPITEHHAQLLEHSAYKALTIDTLQGYGCRVSEDGSRMIVPVLRELQVVGCYTVSLRLPAKPVVARFLRHGSMAWSSLGHGALADTPPITVVAVSDVCEAMFLAQCGLHAVCVPSGVNWDAAIKSNSSRKLIPLASVWGLTSEVKQVQLWLTRPNTLPYRFFVHVWRNDISCGTVNSSSPLPLYERKPRKIQKALKGSLTPVLSDEIVDLDGLEDEIYHRLTHRNQIHGVQFKRFPTLQGMLLGHRPGEVTVVSGPTGAGKTTLMAEYSLDLASQGVSTLWVSLEVTIVRLAEVLMQQHSGEPLPVRRADFKALAADFRGLPIAFLNTHGQQPIDQIIQKLREACVMRGVQHVLVDNLQFLVGCQDSSVERWGLQDRAMSAFRSFATQHQCHVTLIVHPKKIGSEEGLTMQSVGGGARITQEADNVMLLQVLRDGPRPRKELQVVKNRYGGHLGAVPLRFHEDSLTMSGWFSAKRPSRKARPPSSQVKDWPKSQGKDGPRPQGKSGPHKT